MMESAYFIDTLAVSTAQFYREACDPHQSIVIEACAGAGKTWILVSRMLRALLDGVEPENILAITFTKKAAGEMRSRLYTWLHELSVADEAERMASLIQRGMALSEAQDAQRVVQDLYVKVLASRQGVRIMTFHGWFAELMRQAPLNTLMEMGVQANAALLDDTSELLSEVWPDFYRTVDRDESLQKDMRTLLRRWSRSHLQQWLEYVIERRTEFVLAEKAGCLSSSVEAVDTVWPHLNWSQGLASAWQNRQLQDCLKQLANVLSKGNKKAQLVAADQIQASLQCFDPIEALNTVTSALWTKNGSPRKLGDDALLKEALGQIAELNDAFAQECSREDHICMVRLSREFVAAYQRLKRDRGIADMADLELCGLHLLQQTDVSAWMQQRLDLKIRHLLVDEFQDTSPLQWQALQSWLSGYGGVGGGAVPPVMFFVGDPKQSIYRFRRAEPRVFYAAQAFIKDVFGGKVLACHHTRRNALKIVQSINQTFHELQTDHRYEGFHEHTTEVKHLGRVGVIPQVLRPSKDMKAVDEADADTRQSWRDSLTQPCFQVEDHLRMKEARLVAMAISHDLDMGCPAHEIFVLARKRSALRWAAQALKDQGVACVAPEPLVLMEGTEAGDVIDLLDVLISHHHDLALARALKSPIFSCADDDLMAIALCKDQQGGQVSWWDALLSQTWETSPALQYASSCLVRWQRAVQTLPPHDALNHIVESGELRMRYAQSVPVKQREQALEQLDALLLAALNVDGGRYSTIYSFIQNLRRRKIMTYPMSTHEQAIQLLTIHGAKGLEANHVYVMDADAEPQRAETATVLIDWDAQAPNPQRFAFVGSLSRCPPSLRSLHEREQMAQSREECNLLYVTMTRAKHQLVFSSTAPLRQHPSGGWLTYLGGIERHEVSPPMADDAASLPRPKPREALTFFLHTLPRRPMKYTSTEVCDDIVNQPTFEGREENTESALLGTAVHRIMELVTATDAQTWLEKLPRIGNAVAAENSLPPATISRAVSIARRWLTRPELRPWLDKDQALWADNEVSLQHEGLTLRIDRLICRHQPTGAVEWWILDYKLEAHPQHVPEYQQQLMQYVAAVQAAHESTHAEACSAPNPTVRAAFICGEGRLVEWEKGRTNCEPQDI